MNVARLLALCTGQLYPRKYSWYSFLLETESIPGPWCDRKDYVNKKNPVTSSGIEPATFRFVACPALNLRNSLFIDNLTTSVTRSTERRAMKWWANSKLKTSWKKAAVTWCVPGVSQFLRSWKSLNQLRKWKIGLTGYQVFQFCTRCFWKVTSSQ
jgi:hypothetical protein